MVFRSSLGEKQNKTYKQQQKPLSCVTHVQVTSLSVKDWNSYIIIICSWRIYILLEIK